MANERLREALYRKGVNIPDLAEATGVDPKTVERWITKSRLPYPRHRRVIASLVQETESYLWPDAVGAERRAEIADSEIVRLYAHRNNLPLDLWDRLLSQPVDRVDMLSLAALFLVERPSFVAELTKKAQAGVRIRLLFGDPSARDVSRRSEEEGLDRGAVPARVRNALALVRPLAAVPGIEIRTHRTTLYNSIFRFDDEMVVNTHVYGVPGARAPALHLRRLSTGDLFATYSASFETLWGAAKRAMF